MLFRPPDEGFVAPAGPGTDIAGRLSAISMPVPVPLAGNRCEGVWELARAAAVTDNGFDGWYLPMYGSG
jgi:hypothetical protein